MRRSFCFCTSPIHPLPIPIPQSTSFKRGWHTRLLRKFILFDSPRGEALDWNEGREEEGEGEALGGPLPRKRFELDSQRP